jgi:hypothetical protein
MTGFRFPWELTWASTSTSGFASFTPLVLEMFATAFSNAFSSSHSTVTTASKAPRTMSTCVTEGMSRISKRPVRSASL